MDRVTITLLIAMLTSCASPQQQERYRGQTVAEVVQQSKIKRVTPALSSAGRPPSISFQYSDHARTLLNEQDQLFPELPNPRVRMFVYPHLSKAGTYVPGYYTSFRLYAHHPVRLP